MKASMTPFDIWLERKNAKSSLSKFVDGELREGKNIKQGFHPDGRSYWKEGEFSTYWNAPTFSTKVKFTFEQTALMPQEEKDPIRYLTHVTAQFGWNGPNIMYQTLVSESNHDVYIHELFMGLICNICRKVWGENWT